MKIFIIKHINLSLKSLKKKILGKNITQAIIYGKISKRHKEIMGCNQGDYTESKIISRQIFPKE